MRLVMRLCPVETPSLPAGFPASLDLLAEGSSLGWRGRSGAGLYSLGGRPESDLFFAEIS